MSLADELLADLEDGDDEEMVEEPELPQNMDSEANEEAQHNLIQSLKGKRPNYFEMKYVFI